MIGLGIFSIATRETVLSGTAREAQYAFYAADAGVECALYAHHLGTGGPLVQGGNGGTFECGGSLVAVQGNGIYPGNPFVFSVVVDPDRKTCARVTVFDTTTTSGAYARRVISQGYNICDIATVKPLTTNPILVERDLDTLFQIGGSVNNTPVLTGTTGPFNPIDTGTIDDATILDSSPINTFNVQSNTNPNNQ